MVFLKTNLTKYCSEQATEYIIMRMQMADISFNDAMVFLDSCLTVDKRELNKSFRDYCRNKFHQRLSVKDADKYVSSYQKILDSCYRLAVENWHSSEKTDFDQLVFSNYPVINKKLKSKWIQNVHFMVFR